jgi:hypothetical protein
MRSALAELVCAQQYAEDAQRDVWDFAVEIHSLSALGLTPSDLRWLVCKGYVLHGREVTRPVQEGRAFRTSGGLTFTNRTCFVLTASGASLARAIRNRAVGSPQFPYHEGTAIEPRESQVPVWDGDRRELRLAGTLVKQFKLPSPNQETILRAFEEEKWRALIDDPLPPQPEQDPKRRLHDTIKSLNRNQKHRLIRFMGNGTGQGVRWERMEREGSAE